MTSRSNIKTFILAAFFAGAPVIASAQTYAIYGAGSHSCDRIQSTRDTAIYQHWITGYLTGINTELIQNSDILKDTDIFGAWSWIQNYCRDHPAENLASAALQLKTFLRRPSKLL